MSAPTKPEAYRFLVTKAEKVQHALRSAHNLFREKHQEAGIKDFCIGSRALGFIPCAPNFVNGGTLPSATKSLCLVDSLSNPRVLCVLLVLRGRASWGRDPGSATEPIRLS